MERRGAGQLDDMPNQISIDAYTSVMKAFFDLGELSWTKDSVLTDLRRELGITSDEHDDIKQMIVREANFRSVSRGHIQGGVHATKKQKPSPAPPPEPTRHGHSSQSGSKVLPPLPKAASKKSMAKDAPAPARTPTQQGRGQKVVLPLAPGADPSTLIGEKVRWLWDGNWCDCVISDYDLNCNKHCLVFDFNTGNETWEWVELGSLSTKELVFCGGPKANLSKTPTQNHVTPSKHAVGGKFKKGAKTKGGSKARGQMTIDTEKLSAELDRVQSKDGLDHLKSTITTREYEILQQLEALKGSDDSDDAYDEE
mmetsp:Transcript_18609/g.35454  ORF Transcript_18609/g.35454 Transcript_18609/m.35454 type:complete len:311 (-) Transcript_18609:699-1631(-)